MINASIIPDEDELKYSELLQWSSEPELQNNCQIMGKSKVKKYTSRYSLRS